MSLGFGMGLKCIWTTSCVIVTNIVTECVFINGTNLTEGTCATYNNGCTINKTGTAC